MVMSAPAPYPLGRFPVGRDDDHLEVDLGDGGDRVVALASRMHDLDAVHDRLTCFDTSSYGPRAIDAMLRVVGVDRLLYGTDVPVVEPVALGLGEAVEHALTVANPEILL